MRTGKILLKAECVIVPDRRSTHEIEECLAMSKADAMPRLLKMEGIEVCNFEETYARVFRRLMDNYYIVHGDLQKMYEAVSRLNDLFFIKEMYLTDLRHLSNQTKIAIGSLNLDTPVVLIKLQNCETIYIPVAYLDNMKIDTSVFENEPKKDTFWDNYNIEIKKERAEMDSLIHVSVFFSKK